MSFPLGKPVLALLIIAIISGAFVLIQPAASKSDLVVWTFTDTHARTYRSLAESYQEQTGKSVDVRVMSPQAMMVKLNSVFDRPGAPDTPDVVEVEIGSVAQLFHPPVNYVGLLPLNDQIKQSGLKFLPQRLAVWSKSGVQFGVPRDVHPVVLTYRKDLFDQAKVDLSNVETWAEFHQKCLDYQAYWAANGFPNRRAMELSRNNADPAVMMLMQQGVNLLDSENRSYLTDPRVTKTLVFLAQLLAGDRAIAAQPTPGGNLWTRDLINSEFAVMITPDFRLDDLERLAPSLAGKLAFRSLPRFTKTDAPTATWGGTMAAIPRGVKDPQRSFDLIRYLYFSREAGRHFDVNLPLVPTINLLDSKWHPERPYFAYNDSFVDLGSLAAHVPIRYVTPYTLTAQQILNVTLHRAVRAIEAGAISNLESQISNWLAEGDAELTKRIRFGTFSNE